MWAQSWGIETGPAPGAEPPDRSTLPLGEAIRYQAKHRGMTCMNLSWQRLCEDVCWVVGTRYPNEFDEAIVKLLVNSVGTNTGVFCAVLDIGRLRRVDC